MIDIETLASLRRERWHQTPETKIPDSEAAIPLIRQFGIVTNSVVSPECPSLYAAYMGEPNPPIFAEWDSPSGRVYAWRWEIGMKSGGFYSSILKKRATWVSWELLPAVLRLYDGDREPEAIHRDGGLTSDTFKIVRALVDAGEPLSTGALRERAGFPKGKERRAAFLKAVEELDARLILSKVFDPETSDMSHALVRLRNPEAIDAARLLDREGAMDRILETYLVSAAYASPADLAKLFKWPEAEMSASLERIAEKGAAVKTDLPGYKKACYRLTL